MPVEVLLPKLSTTMDEGTIVRWLKREGESVHKGEALLELETDKALMTVEAPASGFLGRILFPENETAPIGAVVALIAQSDEFAMQEALTLDQTDVTDRPVPTSVAASGEEEPPTIMTLAAEQPARGRTKASPYARRLALELGVDLSNIVGSGQGGRIVAGDVRAAAPPSPEMPTESSKRVIASPVACKMAEELNVDLSTLQGSGAGGRIVIEDVRQAAGAAAQPAASPVSGLGRTMPLSGVRRAVFQNMSASAGSVARVTLSTEVDATRLVEWRAKTRELGATDMVPSYTDMAVLMAARALREHPHLNIRLEGDDIRVLEEIHIGVAVDTERGLLVPVLHNADTMGIIAIASESKRLIGLARSGKATPDDLSGGTFTVTNLGMYEIDGFTPIIRLPECAILGLGRITPKLVVWKGESAVRHMQVLSLSFDHRLVDGAYAARFLQRIKQLIEEPLLLLEFADHVRLS
jgi:pyruvate dehydrogenase E2 component (dihydrolipoamide acetyltransferase)